MFKLMGRVFKKFKSLVVGKDKFYINVPYVEKNAAKKLGAKWDPQKKSWFIPGWLDSKPFERWLQPSLLENANSDIRADGFFVAESLEPCWRCRCITQVFTFLLPEKHQTKELDEDEDEEGSDTDKFFWVTRNYNAMVSFVSFINKNALECIQKISPCYYLDFSKAASCRYYMNHCQSCGSPLGDFYMHSEPGGAFQPMSEEDTTCMKLYWFNELFDACADYSPIDVSYFDSMQKL